MRVAYPMFESINALDTSNLRTLNLYNLANNLFGRLVEYNLENQLVPAVADSFSIIGQEVVFSFGAKVKTIDGHIINAYDAAYSLKRLVFLGRSGHGDIRRLLCPNEKLTSIESDCTGIRVENNKLYLKPVRNAYIPFLISALESADYSIIPRSSLSNDGVKILDYRNTSGPFYVESDSEDGAYIFKANPQHYHFHSDMPQLLQFVPTEMSGGLEKLESKAVDIVTTSEFYAGKIASDALGPDTQYTVFASQPFRVEVATFSNAALSKFTAAQRFQIAREYYEVKLKFYPTPGSKPTLQFFQLLSDGSLTSEQIAEIEKLRQANGAKFSNPATLGLLKKFATRYDGKFNPNHIHPVGTDRYAFEYPMHQRADLWNVAIDSAWTENLSLLGHCFETGFFYLPGLNEDQWISDYLNIESREERIQRLNKLHYDLLKIAKIVPFAAYPYYAVTTKNWSLNFSPLSSTTDLWRIRAN